MKRMLNPLFQRLHQLGGRLQTLEQSLFRKQIVIPFLLARLALIAAMLIGFYLAFAGTD